MQQLGSLTEDERQWFQAIADLVCACCVGHDSEAQALAQGLMPLPRLLKMILDVEEDWTLLDEQDALLRCLREVWWEWRDGAMADDTEVQEMNWWNVTDSWWQVHKIDADVYKRGAGVSGAVVQQCGADVSSSCPAHPPAQQPTQPYRPTTPRPRRQVAHRPARPPTDWYKGGADGDRLVRVLSNRQYAVHWGGDPPEPSFGLASGSGSRDSTAAHSPWEYPCAPFTNDDDTVTAFGPTSNARPCQPMSRQNVFKTPQPFVNAVPTPLSNYANPSCAAPIQISHP